MEASGWARRTRCCCGSACGAKVEDLAEEEVTDEVDDAGGDGRQHRDAGSLACQEAPAPARMTLPPPEGSTLPEHLVRMMTRRLGWYKR